MASNVVDKLLPSDIAAYLIGVNQMIEDLNFTKKRVPGGRSRRIEFVHLSLMRVQDDLRELALTNPEKLADICFYVELSETHIAAK